MKLRTLVPLLAVLLLLGGLAVVAAPAIAQTPTPPAAPGNGNGNGSNSSGAYADSDFDCPMYGNGNGAGFGGMMGNGLGFGMMAGGSESSLIDVAAAQLSMTRTQLITALGGTKSIAQVASEHNVAVSTIVDAFIVPRQERLTALVEAGRITQAQADQMLTTMRTEVTEKINEVWQSRGNGNGAGFVDEDGDGLCDMMENGNGNGGNGTGFGDMMGRMGQMHGRMGNFVPNP